MPSYTRGKKRENFTFVAVNNTILYGFKTKDISAIAGVSSADLVTQLGHMTATEAANAGAARIMVVGANAPKPPRVSKKISNAAVGTQQSVSTFCSVITLSAALGAGWNLVKTGRGVILRAASAGKGTVTAVAKLSNGASYAFPMNKADFDAYGAQLGLESAATVTTPDEKAKLVSGSNNPRPGRAALELADGSIFSSFFSSATDLGTSGFSQLTQEVVLVQAAGGGT